ncbi:hypothetical protein EDD41_2720 [Luteococcus japonicus]|uniref:Uncharacterized protein n=1 Tax=Luteococcus japonicus TaxID=33984 RepID=A0A3N1ZXA1_9ACTN|nr:hypothetical protein [Luteococcus japonicus]ROR55446.1 hypothetical protein EDD41_2720 [Luteococcus japonicus]
MSSEEVRVGETNLGNLPMVWKSLDLLYRQVDEANSAHRRGNLLSERRFDEATATGRRTYITARSFMAAARDSNRALVKMLQMDGIRPFATWSAIRPAFECAFYAAWMLEPDLGHSRMKRGLCIAINEHKSHAQRRKLQKEIALAWGDVPADHPDLVRVAEINREHEALYTAEANALGLTYQKAGAKVNIVDELPKMSFGDITDPWVPKWMTLVWRELSAATHGDQGAIVGLSDRQQSFEIPGGQHVLLSPNDDSLMGAMYASVGMQRRAMELFIERSSPFPKQS